MDKLIQADLYRYGGRTSYRGLTRALLIPGFRYTYLFRKVSKNERNPLRRTFWAILKRWSSYKYGFQIPASTVIGEGLFIGHFGTIVINEDVVIGRNCNIAHGVTLGVTRRGKMKGSPTIGDKVWIGTGAVIVGKVEIGSNVLIAPNSYVNRDIPGNSIVMGNPATVIERVDPCEGYINFEVK